MIVMHAVCLCVQVLLEDAKEMLAQWLDKRLGSTITDENNHIFASLPRKFEAEFHADMDALNVSNRLSCCIHQFVKLLCYYCAVYRCYN